MSEPGRHADPEQPPPGRYEDHPIVVVGRGIRDFFGELLGEALAAALACLIFGGFGLLVTWGFATAPRSTALMLAGVVGLALYGGFRIWRGDEERPLGFVGRLAIVWFIFVVIWLSYVAMYCSYT